WQGMQVGQCDAWLEPSLEHERVALHDGLPLRFGQLPLLDLAHHAAFDPCVAHRARRDVGFLHRAVRQDHPVQVDLAGQMRQPLQLLLVAIADGGLVSHDHPIDLLARERPVGVGRALLHVHLDLMLFARAQPGPRRGPGPAHPRVASPRGPGIGPMPVPPPPVPVPRVERPPVPLPTTRLAPARPLMACSTSPVSDDKSLDRPEPPALVLPSTARRPRLATFSRSTSFSPLGMTVSLALASCRPSLPSSPFMRLDWPSSSRFLRSLAVGEDPSSSGGRVTKYFAKR